jgi:hypothetical protein
MIDPNCARTLNPHDRAQRNASVVAARCDGDSWASIERRFGVSARQARRIVKDVGSASVTNITVIDPIAIIEAAVLRCEAVIAQLAEIADDADDPVVAVNAIRAQIRAAESEMALLQNAGMLPTPLSIIGQQIDARRTADQAIEVLNRHHVSAAVKKDLLAALRASS